MRPGLLCPGKLDSRSPLDRVCSRFNEAGAVMPRKAGSCGLDSRGSNRGFNEAGAVMPRKGALVEILRKITKASMRPGLLCPGKANRA